MNLNLSIGPLVSLIAGILILVVPRMLNYIVAIYLIVIGLLGLFGGSLRLKQTGCDPARLSSVRRTASPRAIVGRDPAGGSAAAPAHRTEQRGQIHVSVPERDRPMAALRAAWPARASAPP